jgi:hypothetical protein
MSIRKLGTAIALVCLALVAAGCRDGAEGGEVKVVREGGPFDSKAIKDCLPPAGKRKWIGVNSSTHAYPAVGVQRYFKITSDPKEGADYNAVVTAKSADGFNIHLAGTFFFETLFACDGEGRALVESFDKQFGVRKFPDPEGGEAKAPWEGDRGWSSFLNAVMLPIIQNELRVAMLKFNCEEIVSSCALVANRDATGIDKGAAKETGVNLQRIQEEIEQGFGAELERTFDRQYFAKIGFRMSQPDLDPEIEAKINQSLGAFAAVSQARAKVQQAEQQAAAARKLAELYKRNPQLAELEKWRIICGGDSGCEGVQIITGLGGDVIVGGKK